MMLWASSTMITMSEPSLSIFPRNPSLMSSDRMCTYGATMTSTFLRSIFLVSYGQMFLSSQNLSNSLDVGNEL